MQLKHYTIEVRDSILGYWDEVHIVYPYVEKVKQQTSRFFSTKITEKTVDGPPTAEARKNCREFAMLWAFEFYNGPNKDVRVRKTYLNGGYPYTETIWENWEWKDC